MKSEYTGNISFTVFGESHGEAIGITAEGLPEGFKVNLDKLNAFLSRRKPSKAYGSGRNEADIPELTSGIKNGVLDGTSFTAIIKNTDVRKNDYANLLNKPRPAHADYTAFVKYGKTEPGGGHFSGRMTAPLCVLGGICLQILESRGIKILSRIKSIGEICDEGELQSIPEDTDFPTVSAECGKKMRDAVLLAKAEGDSLGGVIEIKITGVPAGVGDAMFSGMESRISRLVFGIPAVKGIEFGSGFDGAKLKGSGNNDAFYFENGRVITKTNNCGGILGGITNGMPLSFKVAVKPTPSISKPQHTVNLETGEDTVIEISGRHDPCIVPRAVPCMEAVAAIAVLDALSEAEDGSLASLRRSIDKVDRGLVKLFGERMEISEKIARVKLESGKAVYDPAREEIKLNAVSDMLPDDLKPDIKELYSLLFKLSREKQEKTIKNSKKYGLLGKNLSHSFSPLIHGIIGGYGYSLFETEDIAEFMKNADFNGINVTSPYKREIIPFLDCLSETARKTGSVNTVVKEHDGSLKGYNTDVYGFLYTLKKYGITAEGKKAVILGSGGVSGSIIYALETAGCTDITVISRQGENNYENISRHKNADILINATPVGMYPENYECRVDLGVFTRLEAVIDLIYNPYVTRLLYEARERGIKAVNGLSMLTAQAAKSAELFLKKQIPEENIAAALKELSFRAKNIVLIGMPSCGKTTAGRNIARLTNRPFFDTDAEIKKQYGKTPAEIIKERGEDYFRKAETELLREITKKSGAVIACGGGVVERRENKSLLSQNSTVVYLKRDIKYLKTDNRPISQKEGIYTLFKRRDPLYKSFADVETVMGKDKMRNAKKILEAIK